MRDAFAGMWSPPPQRGPCEAAGKNTRVEYVLVQGCTVESYFDYGRVRVVDLCTVRILCTPTLAYAIASSRTPAEWSGLLVPHVRVHTAYEYRTSSYILLYAYMFTYSAVFSYQCSTKWRETCRQGCRLGSVVTCSRLVALAAALQYYTVRADALLPPHIEMNDESQRKDEDNAAGV